MMYWDRACFVGVLSVIALSGCGGGSGEGDSGGAAGSGAIAGAGAGAGGGSGGEPSGGTDAGVSRGGGETGGSGGASGGAGGGTAGQGGTLTDGGTVEQDGAAGCPPGFTGPACDNCDATHFGPTCAPVTCQNGACGVGTCSGISGNGQCDSCGSGFRGVDCDSCDAAHFGPSCDPVTCQNGTCGVGTCGGSAGDGHCTSCNFGWAGDDCAECVETRFGSGCTSVITCRNGICNAGTCYGVAGSGECDACNPGASGPNCDACDATHFGATCAPVTCQNGTCGAGTCSGASGDGQCDACDANWTGDDCDDCDGTHFGAGCAQTTTCVNGSCQAGTCSGLSGSGECDSCNAGYAGPNCDQCAVDTFGADCQLVTCENGTCLPGTCSGLSGNGECDSCDPGYSGPNCTQICTPYAVESCYEGPSGTEGVGICRAGTRTCHQSGRMWSPCFDQVTPWIEDICGNGLDDTCTGSEADTVCGETSAAAWVDGDNGSDITGNGSHDLPWATLAMALASGKKLIIVRSDVDGTVYPESFSLGFQHDGTTLAGYGPTRPVIVGAITLQADDVVFENVELAYPDPATVDPDPTATVRGTHNYRTVWRNVRFSAPAGLPAGASLYSAHHGYDQTFVDVEVDDVVLAPGTGDTQFSYTLLNARDHGSGSQFIRVRLGSVTLSGTVPASLTIEFIRAWGYCDGGPEGVTTVKNTFITGLDMTSMATTTNFEAIDVGCYYGFTEPAGFRIFNNTFADVAATNLTFANFDLPGPMQTWVSGNIIGPNSATTVTGVKADNPVTVEYSDFFGVTTSVSGMAAMGTGNIALDPLFVGSGDYHLDTGSPCIDAGDPALVDKDASRIDMGAYGGLDAP